MATIEDTALHLVLGFAHVPDNVVNDLEKQLPALARLCKTARLLSPVATELTPIVKALIPKLQAISEAQVKDAGPMISDLMPLIDKLKPLYGQAMAIVSPEQADFQAVIPVLQELADFVNKRYPSTLGSGVE